MTVIIIGLGFVGLTLGLALADKGIKIHGVEKSPTTFDSLSKGIPTVNENGIDQYMTKNLGKTFFVHQNLSDIQKSDRRNQILSKRTETNGYRSGHCPRKRRIGPRPGIWQTRSAQP